MENLNVMTEIVAYIRSANISEREQEMIIRDIMAMLAAGEREGRSAEEIIGDDPHAFCDEVIAAVKPRSLQEQGLETVCKVLLVLLALEGVRLVFSFLGHFAMEGTWPYVNISLGGVIGSVVLSLGAFIIYDYISKKERTHDTKIKLILVFVCLLVYEMVALLLNQPTITMHIGVLVGMIVVLIAGYRFFSVRFEDRRERR
jgi:uncharacterized membrane-anchored protein